MELWIDPSMMHLLTLGTGEEGGQTSTSRFESPWQNHFSSHQHIGGVIKIITGGEAEVLIQIGNPANRANLSTVHFSAQENRQI